MPQNSRQTAPANQPATQHDAPSPCETEDSAELNKLQLIKLTIDLGPIMLFALAYWKFGLFYATGTLMAASVISLIASKLLLRRIEIMPAVTAAIVLVFGGLTLWLQDSAFIKMKPTIVYLIFAAILFVGLATRRNFLSHLFGQIFNLTNEGWRLLTIRWACFFVALAIANELIWRNFSEQVWIYTKVFGFTGITMIFAILQIGLLKRFEAKSDSLEAKSDT